MIQEGEETMLQVSMKSVMKELVEEARDDNIIIIEIHGKTGQELSIDDFSDMARMNIVNH